ncbi:polyamine ABC transporter ATP-binding protein [Brevibacterium sp. 5221]|uniref:Spermidine/putrescine import ATP-binding protein PotA n=1 Tax=Brevibacterium rongguiense TaxID=2695267 RepID=A0A6N9H421_9MICO|nr:MULTISPECIES: ABC transporter ATP-binding protein [Brevibacterium]MYM18817.1 polyamine ABC transporter ATP-binding protein [Brevibacterium rongguiense]WAL39887.1 ABC transporter ATP-binding protein [Brevibacterium sp. BRM-1]
MTTTSQQAASPATTGGRLTIREIRKDYGEHTAIKRLDLEVRAGEFLSLLGPSGCGKTTLLRMIAGFEEPTSGAIELDGEDIAMLPPYKRPVNTVFQSYALFPHMSVAENVAYGLKRAKVAKKDIGPRVSEALRLVRMEGFAERRPDMLSGGQRQRAALARALVNRPRVLLLDEPMSALDRKLREEMQLELIRLHTDIGLTFVFVTHDQEEALAMSDRIVVMNDGVVQQIGEAEEIYQAPANAFVAGFIGKQNFVAATVGNTDGDTTVLHGETADLEVPVAAARDFAHGITVQAAIRPEVVAVAPGAPAGGTRNAVAGTVVGESFLGDVVQYLVRVGDREVLARVPAVAAPEVHEGDAVALSWAPEAVQVFGDE